MTLHRNNFKRDICHGLQDLPTKGCLNNQHSSAQFPLLSWRTTGLECLIGFPGCTIFPPNAHTQPGVTDENEVSHRNLDIKTNPHLDPCLFFGKCQSRRNILKTSTTPLDFTASCLVSLSVHL